MRKFSRVNAPADWAQNEEKWNRQRAEAVQRNESAVFSWYVFERKTAREIALPHLSAQTYGHCSFCDAFPVAGVSNETIEHFRPKNRFPQYAYTWTNLYYCCNACQTHKGEAWDDGLIAPDSPDYEFTRYFEFDFTTGEMAPSTNASDPDKTRARVTLSMYGLDIPSRRRNRLLELRRWRRGQCRVEQLDEYAYRDYLEFAARGTNLQIN